MIRICYDEDAGCPTLEPQLLKANSRPVLNEIFGTEFTDDQKLLKYMNQNKTECALRVFESTEPWKTPEYIANAIK